MAHCSKTHRGHKDSLRTIVVRDIDGWSPNYQMETLEKRVVRNSNIKGELGIGGGVGSFVRGLFRWRTFRRGENSPPFKSQSLHCLTHTLPKLPDFARGNFATFLKNEIFPRNYPRPKLSPPPPLVGLYRVGDGFRKGGVVHCGGL